MLIHPHYTALCREWLPTTEPSSPAESSTCSGLENLCCYTEPFGQDTPESPTVAPAPPWPCNTAGAGSLSTAHTKPQLTHSTHSTALQGCGQYSHHLLTQPSSIHLYISHYLLLQHPQTLSTYSECMYTEKDVFHDRSYKVTTASKLQTTVLL